jgi:hypothetical protein
MSTLTVSLACGKPGVRGISAVGIRGETGSSMISGAVIRESTDWDEATRILGGDARRKGGEGEFGWLKDAGVPEKA